MIAFIKRNITNKLVAELIWRKDTVGFCLKYPIVC